MKFKELQVLQERDKMNQKICRKAKKIQQEQHQLLPEDEVFPVRAVKYQVQHFRCRFNELNEKISRWILLFEWV